jgi:haloalkane dehalogenase
LQGLLRDARRAGTYLAIDPRMRMTDFRPSPALYPFQSRWFDGPHGRIHYLDEGQGPPVLLVHGNPTWSFLYRKVISKLVASGFRCVAPDLLGYGLSEHPPSFGFRAKDQVEALSTFTRALELRELIVFGQDWGGPIGLAVSVRAPESIRGIVLGSTFAWPATGITRLVGYLLRFGPIQRWMVNGSAFIAQVMRLARAPLTPQERDHYALVAATPGLRLAKTVLPRELLDAEDWLGELEADVSQRLGHVRTLLFHAKKDALSRRSVGRLGRLLPDHVLITLPNAGHFFQEDAPVEVAAAIRDRFA